MSSNRKPVNTDPWDKNRGIIRSSKGGWFAGKGVFNHGYNMMEELVGKASYMQVVILNATGRLPERREADWIEAMFICLSWPDPRIWCNQIGALGGTTRISPIAATCAGLLGADSKFYGIKPIKQGMAFLQTTLTEKQAGRSIKDIVESAPKTHGQPSIMGFARPLAKGDERIPALERTAKNLGYEPGPHLQLAYEVSDYLFENYNESMNVNGFVSAFILDCGYTPEEAYRSAVTLVASGITACYVDTADKLQNSFLPLRCDDINYQGQAQRAVPGT